MRSPLKKALRQRVTWVVDLFSGDHRARPLRRPPHHPRPGGPLPPPTPRRPWRGGGATTRAWSTGRCSRSAARRPPPGWRRSGRSPASACAERPADVRAHSRRTPYLTIARPRTLRNLLASGLPFAAIYRKIPIVLIGYPWGSTQNQAPALRPEGPLQGGDTPARGASERGAGTTGQAA